MRTMKPQCVVLSAATAAVIITIHGLCLTAKAVVDAAVALTLFAMLTLTMGFCVITHS